MAACQSKGLHPQMPVFISQKENEIDSFSEGVTNDNFYSNIYIHVSTFKQHYGKAAPTTSFKQKVNVCFTFIFMEIVIWACHS